MKFLLASFSSVLLGIIQVRAQGEVDFRNLSSTPLLTNTCAQVSGPMAGANSYRVGFYVAPFGSTSFSLVALATNSVFPGFFNRGFVALPGYPTNTPFSFEFRAWSLAAGTSYEEAVFNSALFLGVSRRGFALTGGGGGIIPPPTLFGTGYGQVPGFKLEQGLCGGNPASAPLPDLKISRATNGRHTVSWTNSATSFLLEWTATLPATWQPVLQNSLQQYVQNGAGQLSYISTNTSARFYRLRRL